MATRSLRSALRELQRGSAGLEAEIEALRSNVREVYLLAVEVRGEDELQVLARLERLAGIVLGMRGTLVSIVATRMVFAFGAQGDLSDHRGAIGRLPARVREELGDDFRAVHTTQTARCERLSVWPMQAVILWPGLLSLLQALEATAWGANVEYGGKGN